MSSSQNLFPAEETAPEFIFGRRCSLQIVDTDYYLLEQ